jgi:hypothetical protein
MIKNTCKILMGKPVGRRLSSKSIIKGEEDITRKMHLWGKCEG